MHEIQLAIIVNSYNRKILLEESVKTLLNALQEIQIKALLVFVDAGSYDGSIEFIKEIQHKNTSQEIVLLECKQASFSEGCNKGAMYSLQHYPSIKYFLFYETDNFFLNSAPLENSLKLIESDSQIATVGFTVEKFSGIKACYGCKRANILSFAIGQKLATYFEILKNSLKYYLNIKEKWLKSHSLEYKFCDIVYTSPLLIKASVWNEIKGMDEKNFPFTDSDVDLCIRILQKGYKNTVLQCSGVIHDNRNNISAWSAERVIYFHKGRLNLFRKHRPFTIPFLKVMLVIRHCLELLLGLMLRKDQIFINNRKLLISKCFESYK